MTKRINMTGNRYVRLVVLSEQGKYATCQCDCGTVKTIMRSNILAGYTTSCGCWQAERVKQVCGTHGMTNTVLYEKWKAMRRRCYNPNTVQYQWYGRKGIKVCERWQDFASFYADMAPTYKEDLSIDRLDNDKDYSPENCQWVAKSENSRDSHVTPV